MTLRQVLSRKWQAPLFVLSMAAFGLVLLQLRPQPTPLSYEEQFAGLETLARQNRYTEFYGRAETLRQECQTAAQLGQLYLLAARTRVKQLQQRHEFEVDGSKRSAENNYRAIIYDYTQALQRNQPAPDDPESAGIFGDLALAYWCLNDADKALAAAYKALERRSEFDGALQRMVVQMVLAARPDGYLDASMKHLETVLAQSPADSEIRAWAFVRKAEVLIAQDRQNDAYQWIKSADDAVLQSPYAGEVEFLRGRALSRAGELDQADQILRALLQRTGDRGDIYAQAALELGRINYEQFRDFDAQQFYRRVIDTQMGKDWYAAGLLGLAECAAVRQRYPEAAELYRQTVQSLQNNPHNRAVTMEQVRQSLTLLAHKLDLLKQYASALLFLEIEQQIVRDDLLATYRYAQILGRRANQILETLEPARAAARQGVEATAAEALWLRQQQDAVSGHFGRAAEQYLRVAEMATGDDRLYGECLWEAAHDFDKAGKTDRAIEVWLRFINEREGETRWPRALFYLAQAYQSLGDFPAAIRFYETLLAKHPKSIAAFDSMVSLAKCYLAQEPPERDKAEQLLRSIRQDPTLTPLSPYFRDALFELGELYYKNKEYPAAIHVLTEAIDRYGDDSQVGKSMFLVADAYRRSGQSLDAVLATLAEDPTATVNLQKTSEQRRRYLEQAREYFNRAIEAYTRIPEGRRSKLDEMYLRHCWLYRADCLYDLGQYRKAAQLYELAALRYQLTPTALAAFVQIVNCHLRLNNPAEARSTTQRAIWQLREMPDAVFAGGPTRLTRQQWQDWFDWTGRSNLW